MSQDQELPLDLAVLDGIRHKIELADNAIVEAFAARIHLAKEEVGYRRQQGLPDVDTSFEHRAIGRAANSHTPLSGAALQFLAHTIRVLARFETGAYEDGRRDPATDAIPF